MQEKVWTHVIYHYNSLVLFIEFCAPQTPDATDSTGGNPSLECDISLFCPLSPFGWPLGPDTLQPLSEAEQAQCTVTCLRARLTRRKRTQQGAELQLSQDKMAILKATKFD